jgi:hypothetical protein
MKKEIIKPKRQKTCYQHIIHEPDVAKGNYHCGLCDKLMKV